MKLDARPTGEAEAFLDLLPPEDRARFTARCEEVRFGFGEPIVLEGEPADALFVIVEGRARVVKRAESGEEVPLTTLGPGAMLGEIALLRGEPRSATARASGDVRALRLSRDALDALLASSPRSGRGSRSSCAPASCAAS